jgi:hypothetical protein
MTVLRIDDLLANAPLDPEAHLDAQRVERYAGMIDTLPPVVVFATLEGVLLADGYHRVAAARVRGLETVEAEVRRGSRHDALRCDGGGGRALDLPRGSRFLHHQASRPGSLTFGGLST